MSARQQLARLLPLGLLILLVIAGLRGQVASPGWNGPLTADAVLIGVALEVVLGTLLVITLVRDGRARRARENALGDAASADPAGPGHADVPAGLRWVLKWILSAGMLAVAVVLLARLVRNGSSTRPVTVRPAPPPTATRIPSPKPVRVTPVHIPLNTILYTVLIVALVVAVALSIWWASRLRQATARVEPDVIADDSQDLREAVESGRVALARLDDARAAIIACYAAMERSLADRGAARGATGTPGELLDRALGTGLVHGPAARDLTRLFYEARFSTHPLGPGERDAARQALDSLADELATDTGNAGSGAADTATADTATAGTAAASGSHGRTAPGETAPGETAP